MTARGIFLRGRNALALDGFYPKTHGLRRITLRGSNARFQCAVNGLQIVTVFNLDHIPAQRTDGLEARLHGKAVIRNAAGKLGVIIGKNQHERIHVPFHGQARNGGERFLRFAFHHRAIGNGADRHAIVASQLIANRQPLRLRQSGAQRAVTDQHTLGIQMALTVTGELAMNAAKTAERRVILPVEIVISAQGVNPVLSVTGVIDEVKRFVPLPAFSGEHDRVSGRHDLSKRRWAAPVTGRSAGHRMNIHQGHCRARGIRVGHRHGLATGVVHADGILRPLRGRIRQTGGNGDWLQRRRCHRVYWRIICSHNMSPP